MAAAAAATQRLPLPPRKASAAAAQRRLHRGRPASASALAATRTFELDGGAMAVAPTKRRPKGLVHFLGGAFVGAAPLPVYSLFLELLAEGGYTCVTTPYAVTFQHLECSQVVHSAFQAAVQQLRQQQGGWAAPPGLPVHGVGHSNGALLHLLIGSVVLTRGGASSGWAAGSGSANGWTSSGGGSSSSSLAEQPPVQLLGPKERASNVLISYNNFRVGKAVPVPLSLLAPAVQQLRGHGRLADGAASALQQAAAATQQLLALSGGGGSSGLPLPLFGSPSGLPQAEEVLRSLRQLDPAVVQLGSVFDEVGDGFEDFSPTPEEARQLISAGYAVPDTLLVQFRNDDTDETPVAAAMLSSPGSSPALTARRVATAVLPGSHVTPCGAAPGWRLAPGSSFGPAEAVAMAAQAALQADTYRLASRVLAHLDAHS
ncbi:hypothetical protein ABPG75_004544 [Micractinium tetrahymenae]